MSVADEILTLQQNISDLQDAIIEKGGTVTGNGLTDLVQDVSNIPSGGGGETPTDYGAITYYPVYKDGYKANGRLYNCVINDIDFSKWATYIANHGGEDPMTGGYSFTYDEMMGWTNMLGEAIDPYSLYSTTGADVKMFSGESWGQFSLISTKIPDKSVTPVRKVLTQAEYEGLGDNDIDEYNQHPSAYVTIDGTQIPKSCLAKFEFGTLTSNTPKGFLSNTDNLEEIDFTHADSLVTIGEWFLGWSGFNGQLSLPDTLKTISKGFLYNCVSFNQSFTIPSGMTTIDTYFMGRCEKMTSTITCNSAPTATSSTATGKNGMFLINVLSTSPAYRQGVKLNGTYASSWHNTYADMALSSNWFRKTIIVS